MLHVTSRFFNVLFIFDQTVCLLNDFNKMFLIWYIIFISCNAVFSSLPSTFCMDMHSWRISSNPFRTSKGGCLNRPWWSLASESEKICWHITCNILETPINYFSRLTRKQLKFEILDVEEKMKWKDISPLWVIQFTQVVN